MSPSRGISGDDFRNPTTLVRVLIHPEGILNEYPPEGFFTFFPLWSSHGNNSQYFLERDFSHLPSGALMATADIPSRGIFTLPFGGLTVLVN